MQLTAPIRADHRLRVAVSLTACLVATAGFVWVRDRSLLLGIAAIFVVGLLAMRLHDVVRNALVIEVPEPGVRLTARQQAERWGLVVIVGSVGVAFWTVGRLADNGDLGFFGLALVYVTFGLGLEQARAVVDTAVAVRVLGAIGGLGALGLIGAAVGLRAGLLVTGAAVGLGPIGLALMSEVALARLPSSRFSLVAPAGGCGVLVGAGALVVAGVNPVYVVTIGIGAVALMVAISARSSVDVVFVILVAAVVWTLTHRVAPLPAELDAGTAGFSGPTAVVLGDSFMSGEGAEVYFEGTNDAAGDQCRRAPTAYASMLASGHDLDAEHVAFVACSGAVADDIDGQLEQAKAMLSGGDTSSVETVLVSIGGNDALFGLIGKTCLLPIDCTPLADGFRSHLTEVEHRLVDAYGRIGDAFPTARIIAVPYPIPLATKSCAGSFFSDDEHAFLVSFTQDLNRTVARAATNAQEAVEYLGTMPTALTSESLELCNATGEAAGVNFLAANSVFGSLSQSVDPRNWIHNSLHPNPLGHRAMHGAAVEYLDGPATFPADPEEGSSPDPTATCVGAGDVRDCVQDWRSRTVARAGVLWSPPLLALLGGAWLLGIRLILWWRGIFGDPIAAGGGPSRVSAAE